MRLFALGVVELAVLDATARAHALHIAGWDAFDIPHAVLMGQIARQDITDDFHVAVAVCAKAGPWRNAVFVDDPKVAKAHVGRVKIMGK